MRTSEMIAMKRLAIMSTCISISISMRTSEMIAMKRLAVASTCGISTRARRLHECRHKRV